MYYPLSQIQTNLYTNSGFVIKSTGALYSGPYWKNSSGQYFTGKTPQDTPTQELTIATSTPGGNNPGSNNENSNLNYSEYLTLSNNVPEYNTLLNIDPTATTIVPIYSPTLPTSQDYQNGEFTRYFCKKSNEVIYIEISQDTYNLLLNKDPQILWQLYIPFNIPWQITGDKQTVAKTNKNIVELTMFKNKYYRFNDYLKNNYLKYFK